MNDKQDILKRAYASLVSLNKNLPNDHPDNLIEESYVNIYNEQLDKLESIDIDVSDFRIPNDKVAPRLTSYNTVTKISTHSTDSYIKVGYFHTKLDALLTYFELSQGSDKPKIGFQSSE